MTVDFSTGGRAVTHNAGLLDWAAKRQANNAKEKAYRQGLAEGSKGEYKEESPLLGFIGAETIDAHNQGMREAYFASIDSDSTQRINQIALENPDSVSGYDAAIDGFLKGLGKSVDPLAAQQAVQMASNTASRARLGVQKNAFIKQKNEAASDRELSRQTYTNEAARLARNGDDEGSAENLLKLSAVIESSLNAGDIDGDTAASLMRDGEREATEQSKISYISSLDTVDGELWIENNRNKVPKGFTPDEWDSFIVRAGGEVNYKKGLIQRERQKNAAANNQRLKSFYSAVSLGADVSPSEREIIRNIDPEAEKRGAYVKAFAKMSNSEQRDILDNLSIIESDDPVGAQMVRDSYSQIQGMAKKDLYGLSVMQGKVEESPIDFNNLPESLANRKADMTEMAKEYGVPYSVLGSKEATAFTATLNAMTIPDKIQVLRGIDESGANEVFGEIADKGQPVLAVAGTIPDNDVSFAILAGQEALTLGTASKPSPDEFRSVLLSEVKNVYQGKNRQALQEAVIAHYVHKYPDPVFSPSDFKESINAVSGGFDTVNGGYVALPRDASANDLEGFLSSAQDWLVEPALGLTRDQTIDYIDRGTPISRGNGLYAIEIFGQTLQAKNGATYEFEYKTPINNTTVTRFEAVERMRGGAL